MAKLSQEMSDLEQPTEMELNTPPTHTPLSQGQGQGKGQGRMDEMGLSLAKNGEAEIELSLAEPTEPKTLDVRPNLEIGGILNPTTLVEMRPSLAKGNEERKTTSLVDAAQEPVDQEPCTFGAEEEDVVQVFRDTVDEMVLSLEIISQTPSAWSVNRIIRKFDNKLEAAVIRMAKLGCVEELEEPEPEMNVDQKETENLCAEKAVGVECEEQEIMRVEQLSTGEPDAKMTRKPPSEVRCKMNMNVNVLRVERCCSGEDSEVGNLSVEQLSDVTGVDGMSMSRMLNESENQDNQQSDTDHPTEVTTVEEMSCRRLRVEQLSKKSVPDVPRMMNNQTIDEECVIVDRMSLARMPPSVEQLRQPVDIQNLASKTRV